MKLTEKNGVWIITCDSNETFWAYQVIDPLNPKANRPRIKSCLKSWWDTTAPGEWTTAYLEKFQKAILIREPRLFTLFKLAWQGKEEIVRPVELDVAFHYCPYVPIEQNTSQNPV